ncbi:beta-propeller domain-containing protein [Psychrobacillus sp. FSL W7-1493]|uniref:beta-propeller domain-containing protein n=1 Tax=Psychrobacillus sp. FSL W7-1493 TaxID=2921552 RepID=UPI0030F5312E
MKKWTVIFIVAAICLTGGTWWIYFSQQEVSAQSHILSDQVFKADFSRSINSDALKNEEVYVTDHYGDKVKPDYKLKNNGKSIEISGLSEGDYTLYVGKRKHTFQVHESIPTVKSRKELEEYFKLVMSTRENIVTEATDEMAMEESSKSDSANHSTTNNQVEGVEEADIVQTNGSHVFMISENNIIINDIENATNMKLESKIQFTDSFYPSQLLLKDETLLVIGQKNIYHTLESRDTESRIEPAWESMTSVFLYDISDPTSPKLIRELASEGYMNGVRLKENVLYIVSTIMPRYWMMKENKDIELRPFTYDSKVNKEAQPLDYKQISILPNSLDGNYTVITTLDISEPIENEAKTKSFLGGSQDLYMSTENLYLTSAIYKEEGANTSRKMVWGPGKLDTVVYKFSLKETTVDFVGTATLQGTILNQFSMDEHDGYFRTVTTTGDLWDERNPSENNLFILDEDMKMVGSITGLAKEERIYSARFMGDKAYMVTFRETDPLFVIDVANPTKPQVLGELKIPGFSNYLHPLGESHLIGFGYETSSVVPVGSKEPIIQTEGIKISLFDVSDFGNPKEVDTEVIGGQGTYSPIVYDHHALFEHSEKNLFGFPVIIYEKKEGQEYSSYKQDGAIIYEITPEKGIVLKADLLNKVNQAQQYEEWGTMIHRLIYSDNSIYTIGMKEMKSYHMDTFKETGVLSY